LTWQAQPEMRGRYLLLTIRLQRRQVVQVLDDSSSLRWELGEILADAYGDALLAAQRETDLPEAAFPPECPWTLDQALHGEPAPDQGA